MITLREYTITILFALTGILIAAYYFNQWLTGLVEQVFQFAR